MTPLTQAAESTLDSLPDGVVIAGADGHVTCVNQMAVQMLGLGPADSQPGKLLAEVLLLQDLEGCDWVSTHNPYDGLSIRREINESAWFTAAGTELLVVGRIVREHVTGPITHVSVTLRSARARARLDRERSDLVATVAHELRSPLTGVRGFTSTLLERWDKFDDDQKKLLLTSVLNDTERLTRLINELLDVARIDTGRLSLYRQPADARALVTGVCGSVVAGSKHEVRCDAAVDLPAVIVDPDRFTQVITNLVENAVRHGDGHVDVVASAGIECVEVSVEDGGRGISSELRRRVFTKFWKHGKTGGSGLGLYIAYGLTTSQGGEIEIETSSRGGARVVTRWPLASMDSAFSAQNTDA